jgi:hypothetical protein
LAINYTTLRNEVETDPNNYGFAALRANGNDTQIISLLNQVRANIAITVSSMEFNAFMRAMMSQLATLSTAQGTQMQIIGLGGLVYLGDSATRTYLEGVYSAVGPKAQLQALYTRQGSRAEQLFGENTILTLDDLVIARGAGW